MFVSGVTRSDMELWKEVVNGNGAAFSILFDRYWPVIYKTAFSYIKDKSQCEEITHDIFLNLWRGRHTLTIRSFPAYLRAAARYHVYQFLKSAKAEPVQFIDDWEWVRTPEVTNAGDEKISLAELKADVNDLLEALPMRCREIFCMSRMEHLTNEEIADRLGISKRTVENQITRALKHLRVQLRTLTVSIALFVLLSGWDCGSNLARCPHMQQIIWKKLP